MNSPTHPPDSSEPLDCEACPLVTDRRGFLRGAAIAAGLAAIASLGIPGRAAEAMSVSFTRGTRMGRNTVSYPLPAADGAQIDHDNEVILVRWQDEVYAFNLSCPHQHTALRWDEADKRFQCPKHHSRYQPSGEFISGRATRNMDRFTLRRDAANNIVVDVDAMHRSDEDAAGWAAAVLKV